MAKTKFFENYSWLIFLFIGIMVFAGGLPHAFGINTDPVLVQSISGKTTEEIKILNPNFFNLYNFYFSGGGLSDLGFAFFLMVVSVTAFRLGQKWAWFAFWFIPLYFSAWIVLGLALPDESRASLFPPLITIIALSFIGLLASFRKFFPNKIASR